MNPYNFSVLLFAFSGLTLALLVLMKRRDKIGKLYFAYFLVITIWSVGFSITISNNVKYSVGLFNIRYANAAACFIYATWYHFCLIFSGQMNRAKRRLNIFFYLTAFFFLFISYTPWFVPSVTPKGPFVYYANAGIFYYFYAGLFFIAVIFGFSELFKKWKESTGGSKRQLFGFILSGIFGYTGGSLTFFPVFDVMIPQYGIFVMPLYPFLLTYFMAKDQLLDTEEIAQAVHKDKLAALGILAASINHEIKSPVYVIKSLVENQLLMSKENRFKNDQDFRVKAEETLQKVFNQSVRVGDMVQRLSRFAKSGLEEKAKLEAVDLNQVLDDILPLVQYDFLIHQVEIIREVPKDLPFVQADIRYMEEILFNLLVNAGQAIKESGKEGQIHIQATAPSVKCIQITITDNGPGIPKDKLANIFKPFYTTKQEGSGLGLYITKQLVDKIDGELHVSSEVNKGTIFEIAFKKMG